MVGRDFGLMRQRNRTTDASMWLRNDLCAGLFRCCGVHVLCTMPADARRPTICRCKQTDSADLRPFETRASSCELVVRYCARPLACLPSESPLNMCSHRRRNGVSEDPADSARRTAASILFHERATAIHHREAACGLPEAAMAPFALPLARRYTAEQTERCRSKENNISPFAMANTIAWDGRRCSSTAHPMRDSVGSSQSLANACATAVGQQLE